MRFIFLVITFLLFSIAAHAQTTTFTQGSDCAASITVTGAGLIVTGTASNTTATCRANVGKASGKWYFTATMNLAPVGTAIGVASKNGTPGGYDTSSGNDPATSTFGAEYQSTSSTGQFFYNNTASATSTGATANGKTVVIAIDMDTDSPQFWVTPDITGTSGFGGGPLWNGSNTSTPTTPGTGFPLTSGGTGQQFVIGSSDSAVYPIFKSFGPDAATFSFATNSTVNSLIGGSGYQPWNTNGGNPPSAQNINVGNAPEWAAGTSYSAGDRVIAGPGWTPGSPGSYTQGSAIYLWALRGASGGTSGGSQPAGFASCASPANVGGGLNGSVPSGWTGATTVADNGITWVCLAKLDYVTMTDAMVDDVAWAPSTVYRYQGYTINGGNVYQETAQLDSCTSAGSGGPSGTGSGITDGGCTWAYLEKLTYSSQTNRWAHQYTFGASGYSEMAYNYPVTLTIYHGGQARTMYQAGQNNEMNPIPSQDHLDLAGDWTVYCYKGKGGAPGGSGFWISASGGISQCGGVANPFNWNYFAATGDGVNPNESGGPVRIDPTKAVTFYSNSAHGVGAPWTGAPLGFSDSFGHVKNIQIQATQWIVIDAHEPGVGPGNGHANDMLFENSIVEADGGPGAVDGDANFDFFNSVIIWNGTSSNGFGIYVGYPGWLYNTTILGPSGGAANSTAVVANSTLTGLTENLVNINVFGFTNPFALGPLGVSTPTTIIANNNATDTSTSYTGSTYSLGIDSQSVTSRQLPGSGSLTSLVVGNQFTNPTIGSSLDLSVKNSSAAIYGAGALASFVPPPLYGVPTLTNATDIFGTTRPQTQGYDVGAEEFVSGPPPPALAPGGRFIFR